MIFFSEQQILKKFRGLQVQIRAKNMKICPFAERWMQVSMSSKIYQ